MKTKQNKHQKKVEGLQVRTDEQRSKNTQTTAQPQAAAAPEQTGGQCGSHPARVLPYVNYAEREANRALPTHHVLELLRKWMPSEFHLAEVVGKWIWITFPEPPPEQVRGQLSQFGFHWNNTRKCWQHPCGQFATEGSGKDPRQKYGTHAAADHDINPYAYNGPARTAEQVAA